MLLPWQQVWLRRQDLVEKGAWMRSEGRIQVVREAERVVDPRAVVDVRFPGGE